MVVAVGAHEVCLAHHVDNAGIEDEGCILEAGNQGIAKDRYGEAEGLRENDPEVGALLGEVHGAAGFELSFFDGREGASHDFGEVGAFMKRHHEEDEDDARHGADVRCAECAQHLRKSEADEEELDEEGGAADEGNIDRGDLREDRGLVDPCQRSDGSYGKPDREGDGCDEERHVKVGEQDRERAHHVIEIEELVQEKRLLSGKGLGNEMAESRALPGLTAVVRCNLCRGTLQRVS